jgi:hypothetical protein
MQFYRLAPGARFEFNGKALPEDRHDMAHEDENKGLASSTGSVLGIVSFDFSIASFSSVSHASGADAVEFRFRGGAFLKNN